MANAGMLTYGFPHTLHRLADCESRLRCVCLCRDKLDDVAYRLPHSEQVYLDERLDAAAPKSTPATPNEPPDAPGLSPPHSSPVTDTAPDVTAAATEDLRFDRPSLTKNASYVYATVLLTMDTAGGGTLTVVDGGGSSGCSSVLITGSTWCGDGSASGAGDCCCCCGCGANDSDRGTGGGADGGDGVQTTTGVDALRSRMACAAFMSSSGRGHLIGL